MQLIKFNSLPNLVWCLVYPKKVSIHSFNAFIPNDGTAIDNNDK